MPPVSSLLRGFRRLRESGGHALSRSPKKNSSSNYLGRIDQQHAWEMRWTGHVPLRCCGCVASLLQVIDRVSTIAWELNAGQPCGDGDPEETE